jgi:hypothetical protein
MRPIGDSSYSSKQTTDPYVAVLFLSQGISTGYQNNSKPRLGLVQKLTQRLILRVDLVESVSRLSPNSTSVSSWERKNSALGLTRCLTLACRSDAERTLTEVRWGSEAAQDVGVLRRTLPSMQVRESSTSAQAMCATLSVDGPTASLKPGRRWPGPLGTLISAKDELACAWLVASRSGEV